MDPIKAKEQKEQNLAKQIGEKQQRLIELTQKVNTAKDKAHEAIRKMQAAIDEAEQEFMEYLDSLELFRVEAAKLEENESEITE